MIERYVFVKLKQPYSTPAGRDEFVTRTLEDLRRIPGVRGVSVGRPADDPSRASWDASIAVRFDSMADVDAYVVHPDHRRYVEEFMKPRVEISKRWNFELTTAGEASRPQ